MNTRSNLLPILAHPTEGRQNRPAKKPPATAKNLKASSAKKPITKKWQGPGEGSKGQHPFTIEGKHEKKQNITTLTESIRNRSPASTVNTSILTADTSSTYMDMEALEIEEQWQQKTSVSPYVQLTTISPTAKIATVGIRGGAPSSVGSLISVYQSSPAPQHVGSPRISFSQGFSPLLFELELSPLRFERGDDSEPHTRSNQLRVESANSMSMPHYGSRSMLGPGDLGVTALLETMSRMLEKYLLSKNRFLTESELLLVMYSDPRFVLLANVANIGD